MREIKFRAWDKSFEQMVEWEELKFDKDPGDKHICFYEQEDGSDSVWNGGADYILMQYTGLKDKNGREIYEGDIVKYPHIVGFDDIWKVEFSNGSFVIRETIVKISLRELAHKNNLEVIGNIYENPELLEEDDLE